MKNLFLKAFAVLVLVVCSARCALSDEVTIGLCSYGGMCNRNDVVARMVLQPVTDVNALGGMEMTLLGNGYNLAHAFFNVRDPQGDTIPVSAFSDVQHQFPFCAGQPGGQCLFTDAETPFGQFDYYLNTGQNGEIGCGAGSCIFIYAANLQTNLTLADFLVPTRNGTKSGGTFVATYVISYGFAGGSIPVTPTPEPSALALVGAGLLLFGCGLRRLRRPLA
jgi:hypothetical protein